MIQLVLACGDRHLHTICIDCDVSLYTMHCVVTGHLTFCVLLFYCAVENEIICRLYNKEAVIEFLLNRSKLECASKFSYIRGLKASEQNGFVSHVISVE